MKIFFPNKGWTLYESATIIVPDNGETKIVLGEGGEELNFVFDFITDPKEGSEQGGMKRIPVDDKTYKLELTNWDFPLGAGIKEVLNVATFRGKTLFMTYFIKKIGTVGTQRMLTVTFYSADK